MSVWYLTRKQTATNAAPGAVGGNNIVQAYYDATNAPLANVAIMAIVTGVNATATIQPVGSNDGINWVSQGSTISVTTGLGGITVAAAPWAFWGANVTALGTSASIDVLMSG